MVSRLEALIAEIEREFGVARSQSSRVALLYIQRAYEEGWDVGTRDIREVFPRGLPSVAPNPERVRFLSRYSFAALTDLESLGRERVRSVFQRASDDASMSIRDVTQALREEFYGVAESRLAVIARTETNRAGNAAKVDRFKAADLRFHEIATSQDARVRDFETSGADHASAHGQVRRIGEPFHIARKRGGPNDNGDRYPPFDPNCRCTVIPVVPSDAPQRFAVASPARLRPWRSTMGAYGDSMSADMRRHWCLAFDRVDSLLSISGQAALDESREDSP